METDNAMPLSIAGKMFTFKHEGGTLVARDSNGQLAQFLDVRILDIGKTAADFSKRLITKLVDGDEDPPVLLRVPPVSMNGFNAYCQALKDDNKDIREVTTRISFARGKSYPHLQFDLVL